MGNLGEVRVGPVDLILSGHPSIDYVQTNSMLIALQWPEPKSRL